MELVIVIRAGYYIKALCHVLDYSTYYTFAFNLQRS